jgi:hypothetical protein
MGGMLAAFNYNSSMLNGTKTQRPKRTRLNARSAVLESLRMNSLLSVSLNNSKD